MGAGKSFLERLAEVADPRGKNGRYYPFPAMLGLAVVAMLAGARAPEAIAQYGRDHGRWLAAALGFRRFKIGLQSDLLQRVPSVGHIVV